QVLLCEQHCPPSRGGHGAGHHRTWTSEFKGYNATLQSGQDDRRRAGLPGGPPIRSALRMKSMTWAAIYARYSSENQRDASIEDQVRQCRARIDQEGWQIGEVYSDHAISGATTLRPGYQKMLEDARAGRFDVLVAEALDRLSRDQENIAGLFKQLSFAGVRLITLSEGEVGELHVGLKGTMNALFLKDLAQKTRRGLEGRVRQGKSGGGLCFSYDVVRKFDAAGEAVHGERRINDAEAAIVRRIFEEFANGRSPRAIAPSLNTAQHTGDARERVGRS